MKSLLLTVTPIAGRAAWEEKRKAGIGASEAAAILGVSPWKSALQLYHEKKGTVTISSGETFARKLGLELEDPIARLYQAETGRQVSRPPQGEFWLATHPTRPYMLATVDGGQVFTGKEDDEALRLEEGVLELKTAGIGKAGQWTDEPPVDYQVQVQHQLAVTGLDYASVVALIGGVYLRYADIKRDPAFVELLEAACEEFWRRVELSDPPPVEGTAAAREFMKILYPLDNGRSIALGPEAVEWDAERVAAEADIKKATERKLLAELNLKNAIGENTQAVLPNGVVYTWKSLTRKEHTAKATTYRDFRRKGPKIDKPRAKAPELDLSTIKKTYDEQEEDARRYFDED